jgi:tetratricopeptide (TPR) repeat protein
VASGDIRQKIVLDGEKEYKKALQDANRHLKTLRSELKAETAELGKNASEQDKARVKTKNLQKQIEEQEKIVKANAQALEEVRQKYGDNAEAVSKYEIKLNEARAALANMKNQLGDANTGYDAMQKGAEESAMQNYALAESFGHIAEVAGGISDKIESVFTGITSAISQAIGDVWADLMDIAAKSDNYLDLSEFLGATPEEVQQWDRAMKAAGGDLSSVVNMISRIKYGGKDNKVAEWFKISGENYTNDLEYAEALFKIMSESKSAMKEAGPWDDAMNDIFGAKKTQEIDGILSDWEDIQKGLAAFDVSNGGVGLTNDELQTMGELYNTVGLLQEKWNAFKESVETKIFGKLALDLTSNAQGALDALIEFMDADTEKEREDAIKKFEENIVAAFTQIGEAIKKAAEALDEAGKEMQGSENGYVRLLGNIMSGLSDVLEWITEPGSLDQIKLFFEGLFAIWATGKALDFVNTIGQLAANFKIISGSALTGSAANGLGSIMGGVGGTTLLSTLGTISATLLLLYPVLQLISEGLPKPTEFEQEFNELPEEKQDELKDVAKAAGMSPAEVIGRAFSGDFGKVSEPSTDVVTNGLIAPVKRARFDATPEQQAAANAAWDAMREWAEGKITDTDYNEAMFSLEDAFAGNEQLLGDISGWLERLMASWNENKNSSGFNAMDWQDLPSTWWKNPNQVTSSDIQGLQTLPGMIESAAERGISRGAANIRITIDGYSAGQVLAPHVGSALAGMVISRMA